MQRPRMRITGPVLDAADPIGLARFYERLLGWTMEACEGPRSGYPAADGWARLRAPSGDKLEFQWEAHYVAPTWPPVPGEQQMMIHLDIGVERSRWWRGVGGHRRGEGRRAPAAGRRARHDRPGRAPILPVHD